MTGASIHSPLWHRIERLKPRLRANVAIERQLSRGQVWYVVRDLYSARAHRFSPAVHFMLLRMDGARSLDEIWREAVAHFGEDAPSQDQILRAASQLYLAGVLQSDAAVDARDLAERAERERGQGWRANLRNPMFLRLPLIDPDRFLNATVGLVRPFASWVGGALWLAAMVWLATQMAAHWDALTADMADRVLAAESLATIVLIYPLIKILHELGHAYAVKLAGGEVHEVGVMLLTLLPAPYVDASASALVPGKWRRAGIAAAGMIVELAIAALAMLVWLKAENGVARALAYDALFIASVSTLLFNGNPLLRFDAYYILSDLLEIPNLASRAQAYYLYLVRRHLFGDPGARDPTLAPGERFWFLLYAPASFAYRMITLFGIALFVAGRYYVIGVALTLWMLAASIFWPLLKAARWLALSPDLGRRRGRAVAASAGVVALLILLVAALPLPHGTVVRGQIWVPEDSRVVALTAGVFKRFLAQPGEAVTRGQALAALEDPYVDSRRAKARARLAEVEARLQAAEAHSPFETQVLRRQRELSQRELAEMERKQEELTLRAPRDGVFVAPRAADLPENFVTRGETVGYVMAEGAPTIRAMVPASEIELARDRVKGVAIRLDEAPWTPLARAAIARETPQASHKLPSPAMASVHGGPFTLDPTAKDKDVVLDSIVAIDVSSPDVPAGHWNERVWVRFDHGASPLLGRLYRAARQLFLGRFDV
ncbi:putative peptide zinc metalloprotease protein [Rhodoblastus acidophilus]|uniref:peptidase M50 n=1 Tax=Rhodoblastus acidophilus TaxID=1074 RepID=UPI00222528F3|nr:peptidase M50 [Rhodoblastus acidophilus]MCW2284566.1 putative peptide zinc metalloprotease protein [Rhodoblastus acidophilus]MCW2333519.1 putative peptide zinc metalloprotease protein [Rhodoblastus acidophilus]